VTFRYSGADRFVRVPHFNLPASHSFLSQSLAVVLSENSFTTRVPKSPVALQSDSGKTLQVPTKALGYDFGIYMIAYRR